MTTPSGTVAFLFTDIEGSTRLWEDNPESMARRVTDHDRIITASVTRHGGVVFSTAGDSYAAAFHTPTDAIGAAVEAQQALRDVLAVRMAVHVGPVETRDGDYFGPTLNRAGRLRDAAHGGQIICSQAVADTLGTPDTFGFLDLGEHRLKDLGRPDSNPPRNRPYLSTPRTSTHASTGPTDPGHSQRMACSCPNGTRQPGDFCAPPSYAARGGRVPPGSI